MQLNNALRQMNFHHFFVIELHELLLVIGAVFKAMYMVVFSSQSCLQNRYLLVLLLQTSLSIRDNCCRVCPVNEC